MFKKRTRPASVRDKVIPQDVVPSEDEEKVASGSGTPQESEDDEIGRTVQELVLLRKLKKSQSQQGIDLLKLNRGEEKKGKAKKSQDAGDMYGLHGGKAGAKDDKEAEVASEAERMKKLVRANNFTQQTNALDVDKHMLAYIERELAKRRGPHANVNAAKAEPEAFDPQAELYRITEKYRFDAKKIKSEDEGNVTNSLGMLTSIPEVDLGMDNRLKNIEMTERAKRDMLEQRKIEAAAAAVAAKEEQDPGYAAARFYRPHHKVASDIYNNHERTFVPKSHRQESATDEQVYERFKKRMKH